MYKRLICLTTTALFLTLVSAQSYSIPLGDFLRFTGGTGDMNDGVIANSRFGPQGLNIVGINNDNTHRQLHVWGQVTQHQNDGTNSFLGSTVFNGQTTTNGGAIFSDQTTTYGTASVGIGPYSYFRAGNYLTLGHTVQGFFPYIGFNAVLTSSNLTSPGNYFSPSYSGPDGAGLIIVGEAGGSGLLFYQKSYDGNPAAYDLYSLEPSMFLNRKGQFGIGFPYSTNFGADCKFAVKGTILTTKVRVSQTGPWPDYVFKKNYKLSKLEAVESYIQQNRHLPDVPTAGQIKKDGLDLGENQAVLLRKVEELTLYIIELNKAVRQLQTENKQQKRTIAALAHKNN